MATPSFSLFGRICMEMAMEEGRVVPEPYGSCSIWHDGNMQACSCVYIGLLYMESSSILSATTGHLSLESLITYYVLCNNC